MSRTYRSQYYVDAVTEIEVKPVKAAGGRVYLLIQNRSTDAIYINFGTHADAYNGIELAAGLYYERDKEAPDDYIYIRGAAVAGSQQAVHITEAYNV